jgi:hypothetical protein
MGRNQRDKAPFAFKSKKIQLYKPTQGQAASFALVIRTSKGADDQMRAVTRFFGILESLVVKKTDWEWMEDQLMTGVADIPDFSGLVSEVFSHEWAEPEDAPEHADGGE